MYNLKCESETNHNSKNDFNCFIIDIYIYIHIYSYISISGLKQDIYIYIYIQGVPQKMYFSDFLALTDVFWWF